MAFTHFPRTCYTPCLYFRQHVYSYFHPVLCSTFFSTSRVTKRKTRKDHSRQSCMNKWEHHCFFLLWSKIFCYIQVFAKQSRVNYGQRWMREIWQKNKNCKRVVSEMIYFGYTAHDMYSRDMWYKKVAYFFSKSLQKVIKGAYVSGRNCFGYLSTMIE